MRRWALPSMILALAAAPAAAAGQDLAARITGGGDGVVRISFETREGVRICEEGFRLFGERMVWRGPGDELRGCSDGPATVEMRVARGRVSRVEMLRLGEPGDREARDLGVVPAPEAVEILLDAAREGDEHAVFPVMIADVPRAWVEVLALAQDRGVRRQVRRSALFWVGQEAAGAATAGLERVARDDEEEQDIRDAAIFALSQRDSEESLPILMDLARTADQAETRKKAFFWLAQIDDPRVAGFFRDVLRGGGGR